MRTQLALIDGNPAKDWQLDTRTKELGRRGVAAARAVLAQANRDAADAAADRAMAHAERFPAA
jgi:hypothetical protein